MAMYKHYQDAPTREGTERTPRWERRAARGRSRLPSPGADGKDREVLGTLSERGVLGTCGKSLDTKDPLIN